MLRSVLKILTSTAMTKVLLGMVGVALIRFMEPEEFADFTFLVAVAGTISQIISSGINRLFIVGHDRLELGSSSAGPLVLQLSLILLASLGLSLVYPLMGSALVPLVLLIFGNCSAKYVQTFYQQRQSFGRFAGVEMLRTVLVLLLITGLLLWQRQAVKAWQVLVAQGAAPAVIFLVFWFFLWGQPRKLDLRPLKTIFRFVMGNSYKFLFGYTVVIAVFGQADLFVLRSQGNDVQMAGYGAGLRYYSLINLGLASVKIVLLPTIKKAVSRVEIEGIYRQYRKLIGVVLPVLVVAILVAGWLIPWLDGGKYPASIGVFQVLAVSAGISFVLSPHSELLHANEEFRYLFLVLCLSLACKIVLTFFFLNWLGELGVAVATTLSFALLNLSIFLRSRQVLQRYR